MTTLVDLLVVGVRVKKLQYCSISINYFEKFNEILIAVDSAGVAKLCSLSLALSLSRTLPSPEYSLESNLGCALGSSWAGKG